MASDGYRWGYVSFGHFLLYILSLLFLFDCLYYSPVSSFIPILLLLFFSLFSFVLAHIRLFLFSLFPFFFVRPFCSHFSCLVLLHLFSFFFNHLAIVLCLFIAFRLSSLRLFASFSLFVVLFFSVRF